MAEEFIPSKSKTLTWSEVAGAAEEAFAGFRQPGLEIRALDWAYQAWDTLIQAGLTTYSTETESCQVVIRFLALAGFYLEFCSVAWKESVKANYYFCVEALGFIHYDAIHHYVEEVVSSDSDWESFQYDDYQLDDSVLQKLAYCVRPEVLSALLDGLGNISMLFVSLWRSNTPEIGEDDEPDDWYETDEEILNYNLTPQKLTALNWLNQQCSGKFVLEVEPQQQTTLTQGTEESKSHDIKDDTTQPQPTRLFSSETFDILTQLNEQATGDFYLAHEEQFKKYVENPFQALVHQVAAQLPDVITKRLELEKARFTSWKNYQAFFSSKGLYPTASSKLLISISHSHLLFGLFIPHDSLDKTILITNSKIYQKAVHVAIQYFPNNCTPLGTNEFPYPRSLDDWLNDIARKNSGIKDIQAYSGLLQNRVLKSSEEQIIEQITQTFKELFPLFLLATSHNPIPAIEQYLKLPPKKPDANELYNQGLEDYQQGNYQESINKFDEALQIEPKALTYYNRGRAYLQIGDKQRAIEDLRRSAEFFDQQSNIDNYEEVQRILKTIQLDYSEPSFTEICQNVRSKGLRISESTLRRYHLALKSRKFVILSGISGTGKTWLTKAYADAVEAEYLLVPVAPNWTTNEDLLGYLSPIDNKYHDTDFSTFLEKAEEEYQKAQAEKRTPRPYHLVLDEMNLARVEYYFAKFLSAMEVRMREGVAQIQLASEKQVLLPPNLYFIGTVNVDETTHSFADKVYDRAQLIELEAPRQDLYEHLGEVPYRGMLMQIWNEVHAVAPFAFRVLDEIKTYVKEAEALEVSWQDALDEQLLQKILPKLKGADDRVGVPLKAFVDIVKEKDFPLSHKKASKMLDTFNQHGFTSYF